MSRAIPCPCRGTSLPKLIHPAVFAVLLTEQLHGYEVLQRLKSFQLFRGTKPDPRGVYRALQSMEEGGYVTSTWASSDLGPAKRLYRITEAGKNCVRQWVTTLRHYRLGLDELLTTAEDAFLAAASGTVTLPAKEE